MLPLDKKKYHELPFDKEEKRKLLLDSGLHEEQIPNVIDSIFLIVEENFVYTSGPTRRYYDQIYYEFYIEHEGRIPALFKNSDGNIIFNSIKVINTVEEKYFKEFHEQTKQKHNRLKILKYL